MTWLLLSLLAPAHAGDWTGWGQDGSRNMVGTEKKVPKVFEPGEFVKGTEDIDLATTEGVRWVVRLGSQTYGNPTVADGRVYVGTNNAMERREGITGDYSVVLAFDETDGDLLWQLSVPKLGSGKVNDWEFLGICSSPTVVGDVVYVVTNRGEVVALDAKGMADGNDGFQDESQYMAGPGRPPIAVDPAIDADILWRYDMPNELGVFPHNVTSSSVLVVDDKLFVATSNGVDWSHLDLPSPFAPTLIVLDRNTGELIGEEISGIGERTMHANWSSPAYAPALGGTGEQVVFGAGDGFLYGFGTEMVDDDGLPVLQELWRYDGNKPEYRVKDGSPVKYATAPGPSEYIATPVVVDGVVYAGIGQDPEHGPGVGLLSAVPLSGSGDMSGKALWTYDGLGRTISTVAVSKGIVYAADYDGKLHAVDAKTGEGLWVYETGAHIWGSPFVAGGKVYLGDEDGMLTMLKAGKKLKKLGAVELTAPVYATPILANGTMYISSQTHLYAIDGVKR
jgi:outer membrane protein assembly factor BamB